MTWRAAPLANPPSTLAWGRVRQRGVTSVEYVLLVTVVFIPSVIVATTCFVNLVGWYAAFVAEVSRPLP